MRQRLKLKVTEPQGATRQYLKVYNMYNWRLRGKEHTNGAKKLFGQTIAENSPNLVKDINLQI